MFQKIQNCLQILQCHTCLQIWQWHTYERTSIGEFTLVECCVYWTERHKWSGMWEVSYSQITLHTGSLINFRAMARCSDTGNRATITKQTLAAFMSIFLQSFEFCYNLRNTLHKIDNKLKVRHFKLSFCAQSRIISGSEETIRAMMDSTRGKTDSDSPRHFLPKSAIAAAKF